MFKMLIHLFGLVILYLVYGTRINGHCTSDRDCTAQNAYCANGTCVCYRGYSSGGIKCCVECTSGQCTCKSGYIRDKYNCRVPQLAEPCQVLPGCGSNLTESKQVREICEKGYCKCPDGSEQFTVRDLGINICLRLCSLKADGDKCEAHNECASKLCRRLHPGDLEHTCIPCVGHTCTPWYDSRREFSAAPKITGVISSVALAVTVLAASHYLK